MMKCYIKPEDGVHWSVKHVQDVIDNYNRTEQQRVGFNKNFVYILSVW